MSDTIYCLILVTAGSETEAENIARAILEQKLAACANLYPIRSLYRWQGEVKNDTEWQIIFKTTLSNFEPISVKVQELHSYQIPEIISLPLLGGIDNYLNWIYDSVNRQ